jgi:hypothetical protein
MAPSGCCRSYRAGVSELSADVLLALGWAGTVLEKTAFMEAGRRSAEVVFAKAVVDRREMLHGQYSRLLLRSSTLTSAGSTPWWSPVGPNSLGRRPLHQALTDATTTTDTVIAARWRLGWPRPPRNSSAPLACPPTLAPMNVKP